MSTLELKELSHPSGEVIKIASGKTLDLKSQGSTTLPTGSVLQIVSSTLTSVVALTSNATDTFVALGLDTIITPKSTSSKILVQVTMSVSHSVGTFHFRIGRGSDQTICIGDSANNNQLSSTTSFRENAVPYAHQQAPVAMSFMDSPATTSATTYQVFGTIGNSYANAIMYLNRAVTQDNGDYDARSTSTITLTEIQG